MARSVAVQPGAAPNMPLPRFKPTLTLAAIGLATLRGCQPAAVVDVGLAGRRPGPPRPSLLDRFGDRVSRSRPGEVRPGRFVSLGA